MAGMVDETVKRLLIARLIVRFLWGERVSVESNVLENR